MVKKTIYLRMMLIVLAISALFQLGGFSTIKANAAVVSNTIKLTSVSLSTKNLSLPVGKTESLKVTVLPSNAANKGVTWKSSNAKVATVSSTGKLTAVGVGTATITCTASDGSGKSATCNVTVTKPVNESKYLNVVGPTKDGFTYTFKGINVNFDSDVKVPLNCSKIKITNSKGVQVPISKVNTTISKKEFQMYCPSMTDGKYTLFIPANTISDVSGKKYNKDIKIVFNVKLISVKSVILNKTTDNLTVGSSDTLVASITPSNATNKDLTWKSSNINVATVDGDGKVKAVGAGKATITCTTKDGNKVASCAVTVSESKYLNVVGPTKDGFTYTFRGINVNFDSDVKVPSNWSKIKITSSKGVQVPISKVNTTISKKEFQMYCPSMTDGKYTLFIPANTISDVSGKKYNKDIKIVFNVKLPSKDTVAPQLGQVKYLTKMYSGQDQTSFTMQWTKATDNITPQNKLRYYLYQSEDKHYGENVSQWESNAKLLNSGGSIDISSLPVKGLDDKKTYYFKLIVEDEAHNKTAYVTESRKALSITDITKPQLVLEDGDVNLTYKVNKAGEYALKGISYNSSNNRVGECSWGYIQCKAGDIEKIPISDVLGEMKQGEYIIFQVAPKDNPANVVKSEKISITKSSVMNIDTSKITASGNGENLILKANQNFEKGIYAFYGYENNTRDCIIESAISNGNTSSLTINNQYSAWKNGEITSMQIARVYDISISANGSATCKVELSKEFVPSK